MNNSNTIKNICVYCGSSFGRQAIYTETAQALGELLAERGIRLIYGGAKVGLMGVVADAALSKGGEVIGVIPDSLVTHEVAHGGLTDLIVTDSMHTRKMRMAELADAFIALPGGWGTLDEMFEVLTWAQLGFHKKPCGLLNVAGYYEGLKQFFKHTVDEAFVRSSNYDLLLIETEPKMLLDRLLQHESTHTSKWIKPAEEL
ncbi:TIGR00730 family Rossman fold protein [uncultured Thiothrix sp.]|uniref:LOG family protein n=1 Tax=uncultured Thiothrix sp. TaxID=223185 RepID=UPI002601A246|nr:TIGR00730 family Rossman fold protein [uncultured Thiothrix sp.]